jgi:outer membrane murein-binding lipoprotein Lpp
VYLTQNIRLDRETVKRHYPKVLAVLLLVAVVTSAVLFSMYKGCESGWFELNQKLTEANAAVGVRDGQIEALSTRVDELRAENDEALQKAETALNNAHAHAVRAVMAATAPRQAAVRFLVDTTPDDGVKYEVPGHLFDSVLYWLGGNNSRAVQQLRDYYSDPENMLAAFEHVRSIADLVLPIITPATFVRRIETCPTEFSIENFEAASANHGLGAATTDEHWCSYWLARRHKEGGGQQLVDAYIDTVIPAVQQILTQ